MLSLLVEIKIRSRGPPDLRAVAHQWAMAHRLRITGLVQFLAFFTLFFMLDQLHFIFGKFASVHSLYFVGLFQPCQALLSSSGQNFSEIIDVLEEKKN